MRELFKHSGVYLLLVSSAFTWAQAFSSSNLPIVVISSAGRGYTLPVDSFWYDLTVGMGIIDNGPGKRNNLTDPYNNFNGDVELRVQGSSSVGLPKRSFRISTLNAQHQQASVSLLGMLSLFKL